MVDSKENKGRRLIDRANSESGGILASHLARAARHFSADDTNPKDRVEVWGRRVGRALALLFLVVLAIFVVVTLIQG